jgi:hypothetical protein
MAMSRILGSTTRGGLRRFWLSQAHLFAPLFGSEEVARQWLDSLVYRDEGIMGLLSKFKKVSYEFWLVDTLVESGEARPESPLKHIEVRYDDSIDPDWWLGAGVLPLDLGSGFKVES